MACMAENQVCFEFCVPRDQAGFGPEYTGLFLFRFYQYGKKVAVVVDDYIPVNKITKKPLFTYSKDEGEMWPCLMEKAYAKLQGSYSHLDGGFPLSSLVDFTGGFPERYWGPPGGVLAGRDEEQVWQALVTTFKQEREALVCTSTPAWVSKQGLLGGHAYTVTGARQLQEDQRLVRVRNPWGQTEWTGAFSKRWILNSGLNRATQNLLSTGGGEFWIPFKDYLKGRFNYYVMYTSKQFDKKIAIKDFSFLVGGGCQQIFESSQEI